MKIKSAQEYSYYMKRLQFIAVMGIAAFLLYKACQAHAHVDLHFHSIEAEELLRIQAENRKAAEEFERQNQHLEAAERERIAEQIRRQGNNQV